MAAGASPAQILMLLPVVLATEVMPPDSANAPGVRLAANPTLMDTEPDVVTPAPEDTRTWPPVDADDLPAANTSLEPAPLLV